MPDHTFFNLGPMKSRWRVARPRLLFFSELRWRDAESRLIAIYDLGSRGDEMPDFAFSLSRTHKFEVTRCRISPYCHLWPRKSRWRDAGFRILAFPDPQIWGDEMPNLVFFFFLRPKNLRWRVADSFLFAVYDPGIRGDEMPDFAFSLSRTHKFEVTRCRISSSSFFLRPKNLRWRVADSFLFAVYDPGIRGDEMPDFAFSLSRTHKFEVTRCRISSSSFFLRPKNLGWRVADSFLFAVYDPGIRGDEMPDFAFSLSRTHKVTRCRISSSPFFSPTQEFEMTICRLIHSGRLWPRKSRLRGYDNL